MPEGPEVERVRRTLEPWVVGGRVVGVRIARRDMVVTVGDAARGGAAGGVDRRPVARASMLVGDRIASVERRGKQLAMVGESGRAVVVHLGMTGRLVASPRSASLPLAHTHVCWRLERGGQEVTLRFVDPRRFGGVWAIESREALKDRWSDLGPDASVVRGDELATAISGSSRPIKSALLDQRVVAGVGNIYADESLFEAGIDPRRPAGVLGNQEIERLARAIRGVIGAAILAGGSTIRDYVDADGAAGGAQALHRVYGRAGQGCVRCGMILERGVVSHRTTVWCARCQG